MIPRRTEGWWCSMDELYMRIKYVCHALEARTLARLVREVW
jgi:hypothetical protein